MKRLTLPLLVVTMTMLCNASAGWDLCPASIYQATYGQLTPTPPPVAFRDGWIGSCIRSGGSTYAPTEQPCPSCTYSSSGFGFLSGNCSGTSLLIAGGSPRGVRSSGSCNRLGENTNSTAAYWNYYGTWSTLPRAFCCKGGP